MKEYLTEAEMAKMLKMSRTTLWELRVYSQMPHLKINRMVRYDPREVTDWLKKMDIRSMIIKNQEDFNNEEI